MGKEADDGGKEYDERFLDQQYDEQYPDKLFLEAIDACSMASTGSVADEIGCNRTTALRRLDKLEERGEIEVAGEVGRTRVWTVADE